MLELIFFGTGGSYPSKERACVSFGIKIEGEILLFDAPEGVQRQIMLSGESYMKINNIFISHAHADHILGLPGLLQTMALNHRTKEINIYVPEGTMEIYKNFVYSIHFEPEYDINIIESIPKKDIVSGGWRVSSHASSHTIPSLAYKFSEIEKPGRFYREKAELLEIPEGPLWGKLQKGESIWIGKKEIIPDMVLGEKRRGISISYSGDTRPVRELEEFFMGSDILIHEGTFEDNLRQEAHEYGHSTCIDAAKISKESHVRYLFIVHLSQRIRDTEAVLSASREIFQNTFIPCDFDRYNVKKDENEFVLTHVA